MGVYYESNIEELAWETRPGVVRMDGPSVDPRHTTAGARVAAGIAGRIHRRALRGVGPDGQPWRDNAPSTIAEKGSNRPNVRKGDMLSPASIAGTATATADELEMRYGAGKVDDRGASDRDKAWFANVEGQSAQRIKRPFYAMGDGDQDMAAEIMGDEWDRTVGGPGQLAPPDAGAALPAP